uniref:Uncharacterized protein n=1 Tax=Picea glauca TaxID=3330 RepID=A0A101LU14_PICGL|nr:hypothetical protein ABT39_MTgene3420 [Picea glauca]
MSDFVPLPFWVESLNVPRPSPKGWVSDFVPLPLVESSLPHPFGRVT